jgi:alpha-L-rhamnosidase
MYDAAIRSTYSNLFYTLTDCPTREKFGWTNDAQASLEQIYLNFAAELFFEKWSTDIRYCMREDGRIPAIIPSHNWGFDWGPVADGIVFKLPYMHYLYTGNPQMLLTFLPYMERYYRYFTERGYAECAPQWLDDWDGHYNRINDKEIIRLFYIIRFCRIMQMA